ncbi:MAG TPA: aminoacyl-histidine dipeptidase [Bacteroidales bacterium]|nr:aminoacyl-histidine dipeptidase [Bacteroidales bacterium]HPT01065.1 aminoacyl-histidine dipeptidase [Bacteroidales bacterium]
MNKEFNKLSPEEVWKNFVSLTQIPRPSKSEDRIQQFMVEFGKNLGLETIHDEVGNVIIRKPATPGMENRKGVILQGHLDMVPQKNSDKDHDFEKDPIEAYIDGEWVTANGTTLGADNGMGVASAMAVLASKTLKHGPVEALFTCDEETGMTGAEGLKPGILKGEILLNLDSEEEGELYVGCAGGTNANAALKYREEPVPQGVVAYKLSLTGLKGGHSGLEIILQRGNSNKLMNRFLYHAAEKHNLRLATIDGGSLRNAIPRESFAVVTIPADREESFLKCAAKHHDLFRSELAAVEPNLKFTCEKTAMPASLIDADTFHKLMKAVYACPNGVIRMSDDMPGLVETSTNLASVKMIDGEIRVQCLLRSSVDSSQDDLGNMIQSVFELAGASVELNGKYPGWKPNMNSPILNTMQNVYQKLYGKIPGIKAIHAGLECGILSGAYPHWDMISFGPTLCYPHSPDEKVNIASVEKFWKFLTTTLENIPVK